MRGIEVPYPMKLWRQGDVLIGSAPSIPPKAKRKKKPVLVEGEATGHSHRVEHPEKAEVWEIGADLYLKVLAPEVRLVHEEHGPITLATGIYRVWRQREYTPGPVYYRYIAD
jgi:hypothetical protein